MNRWLSELICVDVIYDNVGVSCPGPEVVAYLTDIEAGANAENQVRILYCDVSGAVATSAGASNVKRILCWDDVGSIPADYNRNIESVSNLKEEGFCSGDADSVSCIEDWAL